MTTHSLDGRSNGGTDSGLATFTLADVPDFDVAPTGLWPASEVVGAIRRNKLGRRTVLRLAVTAAMGLGLAALDLIPVGRRAWATNPNPILSVWGDCRGYISPTTVCVPSSAYYSGTCAGSWHRNDHYYGSSVTYDYTFNNTSCSGRNAWKWFGASGAGHSTLRRKCSDGHTYYVDGSTYRNGFSICRTAI